MQQYVRLSESASPRSAGPQYFVTQFADDVSDPGDYQGHSSQKTWWERIFHLQRKQPEPQSGYMTLIPLSDARLKPRRTALLIGTLLFVTLASVCAVYLFVARGITLGPIKVDSSHIAFNTSESTYVIVLSAKIPIYNPNYAQVKVCGILNVSFYDQQAGYAIVEPTYIPARSLPQVVSVDMDASSVPSKYIFSILVQCHTFPKELIFFVTGNLKVNYLSISYNLPIVDSYFIIKCPVLSAGDDDL